MGDKIIIEMQPGDEPEELKEIKRSIRVLSFRLADENYGIKLDGAKSVARLSHITKVPNMPDFILGVMNLRGEIVPVIDIRYFFGIGHNTKNEEERIIVTDTLGSPCGLAVDSVDKTIDIDESAIQPPLPTLKGAVREYTMGQVETEDKNILILIDIRKIMNSDEIEKLKKGEWL